MKKQLRRLISVLLALSMCVLLLTGCGSTSSSGNETGGNTPGKETGKNDDKKNNSNSSLINKDAIYKSTPFEVAISVSDIAQVTVSGDTLYMGGYVYDLETGLATYCLYAGGLDGSDLKVIYEYSENDEKYPIDEGTEDEDSEVYTGQSIQSIVGDGQGNLITLTNKWTQTADEYISEMLLVKIDREGNELWNASLKDVSYANCVACGGDKIVISYENILYVFGGDGSPLNQIEFTGNFWINSMVALEDGRVYVTYYDYSNEYGRYVLAPVDLQTGQLGEAIENTWANLGMNLVPGIGYDIFLQNSNMIAGYNIGDENYTELLNFVDSDIDAGNMNFICPTAEGKFLMGAYNIETWNMEMFELTKVDPADVKDKVVLTLGMLYSDYQMTSEVIKFNKTNEDYRIKLVIYNTYNSDENPEGAITQLNNDITGGKMPDILITNSYSMPLNSYISKGSFEDLYTWLDSDGELNREDYMPNVLEAFTVDGKLYQITPSFSMSRRTSTGRTRSASALA